MTALETLDRLRDILNPALLWTRKQTLVEEPGEDGKGKRDVEIRASGKGRYLVIRPDRPTSRTCVKPTCGAVVPLNRWAFPLANGAVESLTASCDYLVAYVQHHSPSTLYWLLFELKSARSRGAGRQLAGGYLLAHALTEMVAVHFRASAGAVSFRGVIAPTSAPTQHLDRHGRYPFPRGEHVPGVPAAPLITLPGERGIDLDGLC